MDNSSQPPSGIPDRPPGEPPPQGQSAQPQVPYVPPQSSQPPQPQAPYAPPQSQQPQQPYPPQGVPQPPGYPPPGYTQDYEPPRKKGMPVWGWVLIVASVFVVIICAGLFALTAYFTGIVSSRVNTTFSRVGSSLTDPSLGIGPLSTASEFYSNLASHDYDSARSLLSSQLAGKYTADDLRARWEALEASVGTVEFAPVFPVETNMTDTRATMKYHLFNGEGKTYTVNLTLEEENGQWKITEADPDLIPEP